MIDIRVEHPDRWEVYSFPESALAKGSLKEALVKEVYASMPLHFE